MKVSKTRKIRYCVDCGVMLSEKSHSPIRCKPCSAKERATRFAMPKHLTPHTKESNYKNARSHYKNGISVYRKYLERDGLLDECWECGSTGKLEVHHRNGNRKDNRRINLEVLCLSCHHKRHPRGGGAL